MKKVTGVNRQAMEKENKKKANCDCTNKTSNDRHRKHIPVSLAQQRAPFQLLPDHS